MSINWKYDLDPPLCPRKFRDQVVADGYAYVWFRESLQIIDSVDFQRLRNLAQLGLANLVYKDAEHSRFAHSIGVGHRGRDFLERVWAKQRGLQLDWKDFLVTEIAGLGHDIGHGPFSHSFESVFLKDLGINWKHEEMSVKILDYLMTEDSGDDRVEHDRQPIDVDQDIVRRVGDLIINGKQELKANWGDKLFMTDIISNGRNGIDVDKLDYLQRDSYMTGINTMTDFAPLWHNMKVIDNQICYRRHIRHTASKVFAARADLHSTVYLHPTCKGLELMVMEAFKHVKDELGILEALESPIKFRRLSDHLLTEIQFSNSDSVGMRSAQGLVNRLRTRKHYKFCGDTETIPEKYYSGWKDVTASDILSYQSHDSGVMLMADDIRVDNRVIDHTRKNQNPLHHVGFYDNEDDEQCLYITEWAFEPKIFQERRVRVYLAKWNDDEVQRMKEMKHLKDTFNEWHKNTYQDASVAYTPRKPPPSPSQPMRADRSAAYRQIGDSRARKSLKLDH